jgi:hypothetical protein
MLEKRYLLSSAPVVDFLYAMVGDGHTVNISGHVSDSDPNAGSIGVALSGAINANVTADSGGSFQLSGTAAGLGTETAVASDGGTGLSSQPSQIPVQNNAPQITGLSMGPAGNGKNVVISGTVGDESPEGLIVSFSGVVSGSATTNASGGFSFYGPASGAGTITAATADVWGVAAAPVSGQIVAPTPSVQLDDALADPNGAVTISGHVYDMSPAEDSVTISGIVSGTATPDSSGYFSLTGHVSSAGTVTATATNVWGQTSAPMQANVTIYDPPPQILDLYVTMVGPGIWEVAGDISDPTLGDVTVTYSAVNSLSGSVTLEPDGSFNFLIAIPPNIYYGSITISASDPANAPTEDTAYLG